jgi:choline dehydrogenase-like flavoprotein
MNAVIDTDALIVGSGFGASVLAARLAGAGWRVLVLEKGARLDPSRDFRRTQSPAYLRHYLKSVSSPGLGLTYAEALGGGSGFYEMVSLRAPSLAFRGAWPAGLDRAAMDPYYALAERELHVQQIATADVPRTGLVFARMLKELGCSAERVRYAVRDCPGSGFCISGCVFGAKQTLLDTYLPQAERAGATILCDVFVRALSPLGALPLRWAAEASGPGLARVAGGASAATVRARFVFVGAGTVGSAALLLRSRPALPRLSPALGRHVTFNGSVKRAALLPAGWPDADMYTGRSHPGVMSYEFLESHGVVLSAAKALPIQAVTARLRLPGERARDRRLGAPHAEMLRLFRRRVLVVAAFGLTAPQASLAIDGDGKPVVRLELDDALRSYAQCTSELIASLFTRAGFTPLEIEWLDSRGGVLDEPHFTTAHQLGSCRMADDPAHGVVDADGEAHGYPGLFVCDGAAIPGALAVNPSLTIAANAERMAERVLRRHSPERANSAAAPRPFDRAARSLLPRRLP